MRHRIIGQHDQIESFSKRELLQICRDELRRRRASGGASQHFHQQIDRRHLRTPNEHLGHPPRSAPQLQNPFRSPARRDRLPKRKIAAMRERFVVIRQDRVVVAPDLLDVRIGLV